MTSQQLRSRLDKVLDGLDDDTDPKPIRNLVFDLHKEVKHAPAEITRLKTEIQALKQEQSFARAGAEEMLAEWRRQDKVHKDNTEKAGRHAYGSGVLG
jgi:hypothetical protein